MYRRTAFFLAMLAAAANAADLTVGQGTIASDKPASLNVQFAASAEGVTALQFDVQYDAAALDVSVQAGPAVGQAGKSLQSAVVQPGKLRVLVVGFNRNTISDGVVATLKVSLKGPAEPDKSFPVQLTATSGANGRAESVAVAGHDGAVKVEARRNGQ